MVGCIAIDTDCGEIVLIDQLGQGNIIAGVFVGLEGDTYFWHAKSLCLIHVLGEPFPQFGGDDFGASRGYVIGIVIPRNRLVNHRTDRCVAHLRHWVILYDGWVIAQNSSCIGFVARKIRIDGLPCNSAFALIGMHYLPTITALGGKIKLWHLMHKYHGRIGEGRESIEGVA